MSKLNFSRRAIIPAVCFLFALIVGVAAVIERIFLNSENSIYTTQYIFLGYIAFFLVFLGIVIPIMRWFFSFLKIRKTNVFDILATGLLIIVSTIPLFILSVVSLVILLSLEKPTRWAYHFFNWTVSVAIFLLGLLVRHHGSLKKSNKSNRNRIVIMNHCGGGPVDYLEGSQAMGCEDWNIVAGINLGHPKNPTFGDKLIARTIGRIVEKFSSTLDRDSGESRANSAKGIVSEIKAGKNVAVFVEGTRMLKRNFKSDNLLQEFQDGVFRIAFAAGIPIQPVVFDLPLIWKGKKDNRIGIRPCVVDVYFLDEVNPKDFDSFESLKKHCWNVMNHQLASSKKVQKFIASQS